MPQAELDAEQAELEKLSQDVLAGNSKAIDKLRAKLDQCPHIWRRLADLQKLVKERMAEQIAAKDPLMLEAFRKRASELRHALQGDTSCTLVKMAVAQYVAAWLFVQFLELQLLQSADLSRVKLLAHAQQRLESAMRSLALARRLAVQLAAQSN